MPVQPNLFTGDSRNRAVWLSGKLERIPIADLKVAPNAVRKHSERSLSRITESISEFGFLVPVVIDSNSELVAGQGRLEAARRLGLTTVTAIRADHLSPEQVRAYRIADNRLAELSEWDEAALAIELADLAELKLSGDIDFDITITGFDTPEIDLIITQSEAVETPAPEVIPSADPKEPVVTQLDDLWELGDHRAFCGDTLREASHTRVLDCDTPAMAFVDAPYNVQINGHVRSGKNSGHEEFAMASGEMSAVDFQTFLEAFIAHITRPLKDGGIAMLCMDWRHIDQLILGARACDLDFINLCVWNKSNGGMGSLYRSKHELVGIFKKPRAAHVKNVELGKHGRNRTNVWDYPGVNSFGAGQTEDLADHPTVKPTALVADAILDVTHRGDIVVDCFGGSGSTLLAAETTGRKACLIELDPRYIDVTIRRWQAMTGKPAIHSATGETFDERRRALRGSRDGGVQNA